MWRRHRLTRTDWPLDEQAYALHALIPGFRAPATRTHAPRSVTVDAPGRVVGSAGEAVRLLRERRAAVLALITTTHETTHVRFA